MDQFVVPQFIEVEDKIFGPVTVRQFLILLVGSGIIFIFNRLADFELFVLSLVVIGPLSLVFAFVKVNGQQFHYFLLNVLQTLFRRPTLRIWRKDYTKNELNYFRKFEFEQDEEEHAPIKKPVKKERIRDLALLVNTGGYYNPDE